MSEICLFVFGGDNRGSTIGGEVGGSVQSKMFRSLDCPR